MLILIGIFGSIVVEGGITEGAKQIHMNSVLHLGYRICKEMSSPRSLHGPVYSAFNFATVVSQRELPSPTAIDTSIFVGDFFE